MEETMEQPVDNEDRIWVPYDELKTYLESLGTTLKQMSDSIEVSLNMIEDNAKTISEKQGDNNE
tara:strand:+ start:1861 stop:2052 length:192 start_codon:yes stop_codon:yes gene_type:complete